jgi:hypothetical protein
MIAAASLGLIVAAIVVQHMGLTAVIIYPVILILSGMYHSGRLSTPDATSALAVFSATWLLRRSCRNTEQIALLLLCASVAIRPDNILLLLCCAVVLAFAAIFEDSLEISVLEILGYSAVGLLFWFLLGRLAGDYGWKVIIHHSFAGLVTSPRDLTAFRWTDYGRALVNGGIRSPAGLRWLVGSSLGSWPPQFPLIIVIAYFITFLPRPRRDSLLLTIAIFYLIVHFLLFPSNEERFFYGIYTFIFVLGAISAYECRTDICSLGSSVPGLAGHR